MVPQTVSRFSLSHGPIQGLRVEILRQAQDRLWGTQRLGEPCTGGHRWPDAEFSPFVDDPNVKFLELLLGHGSGRFGHEVDGFGCFGKRDDFAQTGRSGEQHDDAVEA